MSRANLGLLAVLLLIGCNSRDKRVVGAWNVTANAIRAEQTFDESGKFTMKIEGLDATIAGDWRTSGGRLVLAPKSVEGSAPAAAMSQLRATFLNNTFADMLSFEDADHFSVKSDSGIITRYSRKK